MSADGGRRVLVVEDLPDTRESLKALLTLWGWQVEEAADGPAAVERALANPPAVVLVDILLPGFNGFEVARRIRQSLGSRVRLIALSVRPTDECLVVEGLFDAFVGKTEDPQRLAALLDFWGGQ